MDRKQEPETKRKEASTEPSKRPYEPPVVEDLGSIEANTFQTSFYMGG